MTAINVPAKLNGGTISSPRPPPSDRSSKLPALPPFPPCSAILGSIYYVTHFRGMGVRLIVTYCYGHVTWGWGWEEGGGSDEGDVTFA